MKKEKVIKDSIWCLDDSSFLLERGKNFIFFSHNNTKAVDAFVQYANIFANCQALFINGIMHTRTLVPKYFSAETLDSNCISSAQYSISVL